MADKSEKRQQVNLRIDSEFQEALDGLRANRRPIPSASEVIRRVVIETYRREQGGKPAKPKARERIEQEENAT